MVTLPTEAGQNPLFLHVLLQQGIERIRINCAHDDPDVWAAMLANLRDAERYITLKEPVRVLMDLAGPKIHWATQVLFIRQDGVHLRPGARGAPYW